MGLNLVHRFIILVCSVSLSTHFFKVTATENSEQYVPCKPGWYFFGEKCYKIFLHGSGSNWTKSKELCALEGGNLASIHSDELQEFLTTFLLLNSKTNAWIGLHIPIRGTEFSWDDLSTVNYTSWDKKEPSRHYFNSEDCVEMRYKNFVDGIGKWNDVSCSIMKPFICQVDKSNDIKSEDPQFCSIEDGGGWKYLNSCYHIIEEEKSWEDAEKYCEEKHNGYLVSILGDKAEGFLNYIMKLSSFSKPVWIGIKMRNQSIQNWASGWHVSEKRFNEEQLHFVNGTCAMKSRGSSWLVAPCHNKYAFICEKTKYNVPVLQKPPSHHWKCPPSSKKLLDLGGDSCYYVESKLTKKWYEANYACSKKGGTLATFHSENETNLLHPLVMNTQERLLIGIKRNSAKKDTFEWADGTKVSYENWDDGEPNDEDEMCGELWTESMKWNDISCHIAKGYICKSTKVFSHPKMEEGYDDEQCNLAVSKHKRHSGGIRIGTAVGIALCSLLVGLIIGVIVYRYQDFWRRIITNSEKNGFQPIPGGSLGHVSDKVIWKSQGE